MTAINGHQPYIINKNLGERLEFDLDRELPQKNADGLPVIPPTAEHKYLFDKNGWLLLPGVLSESEIEEMREFCLRLHFEADTMPEHMRTPLAGPTQKLVDHPIAVGMLNEFTANPSLSSQECYGFSLDHTGLWYRVPPSRRAPGESVRQFVPHNGNGLYRFPGDVHFYNAFPGKAFCPHMRVVWELNPVKYKQGGTLLVSGSHKSVYTAPDEIMDPNSDIWTTYECPAGSLLFFAEAVTHSTDPWVDEENDRIAIHCLYNQVDGGWAKPRIPHPDVLAKMPPMRRTLFRERYIANNVIGADYSRLY